MIQRIQSIFLLVVVVSMLVAMFFPIWEKENQETKEKTTLTFLKMEYQKEGKVQNTAGTQATYYLLILAGVIIFSATYSIFRFDSRLMQMKIGLFNSLILSIILVVSVYLISYYGETSFAKPLNGDYFIGFYLPIVAIIANLAANRFIRKDEKLVRSADRMR
jgi:glucan phosphoethanolaminetransferase (alkaline phosphatase superfamily)